MHCLECKAKLKRGGGGLLCARCSVPWGQYGPLIVGDHESLFTVQITTSNSGLRAYDTAGVFSDYATARTYAEGCR